MVGLARNLRGVLQYLKTNVEETNQIRSKRTGCERVVFSQKNIVINKNLWNFRCVNSEIASKVPKCNIQFRFEVSGVETNGLIRGLLIQTEPRRLTQDSPSAHPLFYHSVNPGFFQKS